MQELIHRIGQAKALVDDGMCRVGPGLDRLSEIDACLAGDASRAIGLADSVVHLCRHGKITEALPALRQLAEIAVAIRWMMLGDPGKRVVELLAQRRESSWDSLWPTERFLKRAKEVALGAEEIRDIQSMAAQFVQGGRAGLPWSHVFIGNQDRGVDGDKVLQMTIRFMGHVLKSLDSRWPGNFSDA